MRKTLWQLQAALRLGPCSRPVLLVEPKWVHLNPEADLWLDVALFEQVFTHLQGVPGKELDTERAQALRRAADLYCGDLLESWYQDWCLCERERLKNMYRAMLDKLIEYCEAHHCYEASLLYAAASLRCECARERTHRQLMRLHYLDGDRTSALRQYELCVTILKKELDVAPTQRTVALYERIRTDQLDRYVSTPLPEQVIKAPGWPQVPDRPNPLLKIPASS